MPTNKPDKRYRVVVGLSARREPDPTCDEWCDFLPGKTYPAGDFPAYVDVAGLVAAGDLEEV